LLEKVLDDWHEKSDFIYLYANDNSKALYPKFGFHEVTEYQYSKSINNKSLPYQATKLDMTLSSDRQVVYEYAKFGNGFSQLNMINNSDLAMFYCTSFLKDNI